MCLSFARFFQSPAWSGLSYARKDKDARDLPYLTTSLKMCLTIVSTLELLLLLYYYWVLVIFLLWSSHDNMQEPSESQNSEVQLHFFATEEKEKGKECTCASKLFLFSRMQVFFWWSNRGRQVQLNNWRTERRKNFMKKKGKSAERGIGEQ